MEGDGVVLDPQVWKGLEYDDGHAYMGQFDPESHEKSGFGCLTLRDKSSYLGNFSEGLPDGFGVYMFSGGGCYAGQFADGTCDGYGVFQRASKARFEGRFRNGKINGLGTITYPDGNSESGWWEGADLKAEADAITAVEAAQAAMDAARAQVTANCGSDQVTNSMA